jgi:glycosyltransferase involved in cell wall biosynthesis
MPKLLVIVPALNEEGAVGDVVCNARRTLHGDVLVVDDGSKDRTATVAKAAGAIVVRHPFNLGVGGAIRTALRYAVEQEYDCVLQVDGDGQHDPLEGLKLLACLEDEKANLVVGSRFDAGYRVSGLRRLMMRLLSRVISRKIGERITDTTSGFRAFDRRAIEYFARVYPTDYLSDTVEALLLAGDAGFRIREVSVRMRERVTGRASTTTLSASYYFVRLLLVISLHRIRRSLDIGITEETAP